MGSTIFVVDSSPAVRRMVEQISAPEGYEVIAFQDGPTALDAARKLTPALIIADYHLDNITFSGFCKEVGKQDNLAETLIVSLVDATDRLDESKLRSLGVRSLIKKPFQREQLLETIRGVLSGSSAKNAGANASKKRQWPPITTATDNEDDADHPMDSSAIEDDALPGEGGVARDQQRHDDGAILWRAAILVLLGARLAEHRGDLVQRLDLEAR